MLSVLLKILAVIGIIILVLLGIVLFLILIVLFVPITYKIRGHISEKEGAVSVKARWFFGIIRFTLDYTGQLTYGLKVLWFDLTGLRKGKPKDAPAKKDTVVQIGSGTSTSKNIYDTLVQTKSQAPDSEPLDVTENSEKLKAAEKPEATEKIIFKIQSICAKIKDILKNISYYINLLKEDDTKHVLSHCLRVILNIVKSIHPKKLKLEAIIGFDSPDTTGKIYGALCMLYPYYGDNIHIEPDFENKVLRGEVSCSGRILIWALLINALRILLDKKFFKVIHKLKNGGNRNGR